MDTVMLQRSFNEFRKENNPLDPMKWSVMAAVYDAARSSAVEIGGEMYILNGTQLRKYNPILNKWTNLSSCPVNAGNPCAAAVIDGELYASLGGTSPFTQFYKYSPKLNQWMMLASNPISASRAIAAAIDGEMYVLGSNVSPSTQFRKYNPTTNSWTTLANCSVSGVASLVAADGEIYAIGSDKTDYNHFYKYMPKTNQWTSMTRCPEDVRGCTAGVIGRDIYVAGCKTSPNNQLHKYNLDTKKWTSHAKCAVAINEAASAVINEELYVARLGFIQKYSPGTNKWTALSGHPLRTKNCSAAEINGEVYVVGSEISPYTQFHKFDPVTDSWKALADCPLDGRGAKSAVINGELYVLFSNQLRKYNPSANRWYTLEVYPRGNTAQCAVEAAGGQLFVIGGQTAPFTDFYSYNPETNKWREVLTYYIEAKGASAAAIGEELYIIGGSIEPFNQLYKYNASSGRLTKLASGPADLRNGTAAAIQGEIFVGVPNSGFYRYSPQTDTWIVLADCPAGTDYSTFVSDGKILYMLNTPFYQYNPAGPAEAVGFAYRGQQIYYTGEHCRLYINDMEHYIPKDTFYRLKTGGKLLADTPAGHSYLIGWVGQQLE